MKILKPIMLMAGLMVLASGIQAQETRYYNEIQKDIALGKELFKTAKYNAAYRQFEKVKEAADPRSETAAEAYYYMALSALRSEHVTGDKMLNNFTKAYADSPYSNYARFYLGDFQFDKKRYQLALRTLGEVDREGLSLSDQVEIGYMMGYAYLMTGENDLALNEFLLIKDKNHLLAKPALYYYAHVNYLKGNYDEALDGFRKLQNDPNFNRIIPIYVSQIYYKQGKHAEVVEYIVPIINDVEEQYKPELARIIGDSYYHLRRYADAIQFLEYYHETPGAKSREDNYIMGFCLYHTGEYARAVPFLEKSSKGSDITAQSSYYTLADAYVRTSQKEKARIAFEAASEMEFDPAIREDALFNYAKLTYELSYSPFNETIKAFDKYITLYPNSDRNTDAYKYLVDVFMVTRNYRDAIASIEKIKGRNAEIDQAYQRVTHYRGLELFTNGAYEQAIAMFDKSLGHRLSNPITAGSRFWRSEALYRSGDYNAAITGYNQFLQSPAASTLPEYSDAWYNLGYAYFKLEDYTQAGNAFRKYLSAMEGRRTEKIADVYNRIGDTYFVAREYPEAVRHYQQAFNMKLYDADYALYQLAFCSGLQRNQAGKTQQLKSLISSFPQSSLIDDAHYELGRTYEREGNYAEAKKEYQAIIDKFSQSTYYPKALLQMGLVHYNLGDFRNSLKYYKQVAENYGGTQEAQAALMGIKNCYIELNDVDAYFAYANNLGTGAVVTTSEQDSLSWILAERQFMANDPNAVNQLQHYLRQYPNGSFVLNARFYLGEALYNQGKYSESLDHYLYVSRQPLNAFSEQALSRASELLFNAKRYDEAAELYARMETVSGNQWNKVRAMAGLMRCNFMLQKFRNAIDDAVRLSKADKVTPELTREASYITAKSYYELGSYDQALPGLREAAAQTNTVQGAEAKYLLADIYFRKQNLAAAEKEIMDFIDKGTSHQFWLAKSFILLSDIYVAKKDDFQAKHTLKSLVENYPVKDDGILTEASRKLADIEEREKREADAVQGNPLQIKLN
ncbi:MAG: tetratricopeptide repeat protein [Prolixibacteraceae bacterium]|nr:tetratricopeptide repeat protein [Prolixibacteraceae bacterium]HPJ79438.1 tetratricopeptide repeat protein [Prolixibacteraceae bacterium]HRV88825.1 tetratricopeptide repeat protein [Prolixibacteraceae bacterium]